MGQAINLGRVSRQVVLSSDEACIEIVRADLSAFEQASIERDEHVALILLAGTFAHHVSRCKSEQLPEGLSNTGNVWIIPANHGYECTFAGSHFELCEIHIPQFDRRGAEVLLRSVVNHRDETLHAMARLCRQLGQRSEDVSVRIRDRTLNLIRSYVVEAYSASAASARSVQPLSDQQKSDLSDYVKTNLSEQITLDDLTRLAGISTHQLLDQFRVSFGTTPVQFVIRSRIHRAQAMLSSSSILITDIALMTGFHSAAHFSSTFHNVVGMTPRQFRDRHRRDDLRRFRYFSEISENRA